MLQLTCERAGIADGMDILDLGCGWGSLTLWTAEKFPSARITADRLDFSPDGRHDRVVSVEMFEHMRNYREHAYLFEADGDDNWMGRHFFTGGLMPSVTMPYCFNEHLTVERHWRVCGTHYQRTCEDWPRQQDSCREAVMSVFERVYCSDASVWFQRWRVFFMARAELFGYDHGNEWLVGHYTMKENRT